MYATPPHTFVDHPSHNTFVYEPHYTFVYQPHLRHTSAPHPTNPTSHPTPPPPHPTPPSHTQGLLARSTQSQASLLLSAVNEQLQAAHDAAQHATAKKAALVNTCKQLEQEVQGLRGAQGPAGTGEKQGEERKKALERELEELVSNARTGVGVKGGDGIVEGDA